MNEEEVQYINERLKWLTTRLDRGPLRETEDKFYAALHELKGAVTHTYFNRTGLWDDLCALPTELKTLLDAIAEIRDLEARLRAIYTVEKFRREAEETKEAK